MNRHLQKYVGFLLKKKNATWLNLPTLIMSVFKVFKLFWTQCSCLKYWRFLSFDCRVSVFCRWRSFKMCFTLLWWFTCTHSEVLFYLKYTLDTVASHPGGCRFDSHPDVLVCLVSSHITESFRSGGPKRFAGENVSVVAPWWTAVSPVFHLCMLGYDYNRVSQRAERRPTRVEGCQDTAGCVCTPW